MLNRVTVSIAGLDYTLLSGETEAYMQEVASYVNGKVTEIRDAGAAALEAAVLGALNVADGYYKEREASQGLREQVKALLEDTAKLRNEIRALKKQIPSQEA